MESAENQAQPPNKSESASNPPLSKAETIALLNESIDRLEETIQKISSDSAKMPSSKSLDTLLTTTQELEAAVTPTKEVLSTSVPPPEAVIQPATTIAPQTATATSSNKPPNQPKRNTGLIVIGVTAIAIAIVTVFWLWKPQQFANLLPEAKPAEPTEVAIAPQSDIQTQPLELLEELPDEPAENLEIVRDISAMDFPEEIEPVAEPIEDVVETVIPDELAAPDRPKKLKMKAIKPKLSFTPEQNLVATLDNKISELIATYSQEFVEEVRVNLPASSLLVRVADDWYDLDESERNSLGNKILERARTFSFDRLELQDRQGTLVARNPIIGNNIILLQDSRR